MGMKVELGGEKKRTEKLDKETKARCERTSYYLLSYHHRLPLLQRLGTTHPGVDCDQMELMSSWECGPCVGLRTIADILRAGEAMPAGQLQK